jgi:hypothetical protein
MAPHTQREQDPDFEQPTREAHRSDSGVGGQEGGAGYVDGLGGIGGSSGAGGARAKPKHVGDLSGIEAGANDEAPTPGSTGQGEEQGRRGQQSGGGLSSKTRSNQVSETSPNQEGGQ